MEKEFIDLWEKILSALFPKSGKVRELENLAQINMISSLPSAEQKNGIISLFKYASPLTRELVWQIKYKRNMLLVRAVARVLAEEVREIVAQENIFENSPLPILIPIPISKKRKAERGWNQTEIICTSIMETMDGNFLEYEPNILVKVQDTKPQTQIRNKKERENNVKGAFAILDKSLLRGKIVILIDDVHTTGATLDEAKNEILTAGAARCICLTVAH